MIEEEVVYYMTEYKLFDPSMADKDYKIPKKIPNGIMVITGMDHLKKAASFCYKFLKEDRVSGFLDRRDSWNLLDTNIEYCSLLFITNVVPGDFRDSELIDMINKCINKKVPLILTTPYEKKKFESELSPLVLSNIVPHLAIQE